MGGGGLGFRVYGLGFGFLRGFGGLGLKELRPNQTVGPKQGSPVFRDHLRKGMGGGGGCRPKKGAQIKGLKLRDATSDHILPSVKP